MVVCLRKTILIRCRMRGNSYKDMLLINLCCTEKSISVLMDPHCHAVCPRILRDGGFSESEKDFIFMPGDQ